MLRFGLFGTGHWAARVHAATLAAHPGAELVGVWGRNPQRAAALASQHGVPAYDDQDALIDAVDAVAVALPPDVQASIAARAATAGRHLLLDKPLALTLADADRVVSAAAQSGVASVVFFTQRFHPDVAGFLGATAAAGGWHHARVTMFSSIFAAGSPYADSAWRREHGALWDIGPHALSLVVPVLGRVRRVSAVAGPRGLVHLLLTHDSGATSTLSLTLDAPPEAVARDVVFFGSNGVEAAPAPQGTPGDAYHVAIDQLLTEVDAGTRDHRCDVRFGRDVVAVLFAAERSLTRAAAVDVPDVATG